MGDVAISIKIMPTSPEVDLEMIKTEISKIVNIKDSKIEPVAFGLKSLNVLIVVPDKEGAKADEIKQKINEMEGVETAEVENVTVL